MEALRRLTNYERTRADGPRAFDLARPAGLLERLGAPHRRLGTRAVQVAGTKGKGSVARFLDACFRAAGLRTGRFLSPHLENVRERIAIDGRWIEEAEFAPAIGRVLDAVDTETTFFEALLAAACLHFAAHETEAVVLEVGLGGRLDATTVVPTTHNAITEIALEHTEILGDTLEQVAAEKASTIRPGVAVWTSVDPASPEGRVIARLAREREAPLSSVPPPRDVEADARGLLWDGLRLHVLGRHQAHNAALAAAVARGAGIGDDAIRAGLASAGQPGCCEPRGRAPTVIVDGAHTRASVRATVRAVADHFPGARPELVFALAADKDLDGIAALLAPHVGGVACVQVDDRRGRPAGELADAAAWRGRAHACDDVRAALARARGAAGSGGLVVVTGSLYLAGAVRPLVPA